MRAAELCGGKHCLLHLPGVWADMKLCSVTVTRLLEDARRAAARSINTILTATYWAIGRRIVEYEQGGEKRAAYGAALLKQLSTDLTVRFGRGFSERNLEQMRLFYLGWPIPQTLSAESRQMWRGRSACVSATSGIVWICCFSTAVYVA